MDGTTHQGRITLLKYVNNFRKQVLRQEDKKKLESLDDLSDGLVLGEFLQHFSSTNANFTQFDNSTLNRHAISEEEKRKNLEIVVRGLSHLIHDAEFYHAENLLPEERRNLILMAPTPSEQRAIVQHVDEDSLCRLIATFVRAAFYVVPVYRETIAEMNLGSKVWNQEDVEYLAELVKSAPTREASDKTEVPGPMEAAEMTELQKEAEAVHKHKLKQQMDRLQAELDELKEQHQTATNRLSSQEKELEELRAKDQDHNPSYVAHLQGQVQEKMVLIDGLESQVQMLNQNLALLARENQTLQAKTMELPPLQEMVDDLNQEVKRLTKMESAQEHYKKKLEASAALSKAYTKLSDELDSLKAEAEAFKLREMAYQQDQATLEQLRTTMQRREKEIFEKEQVSKQTREELIALQAEYRALHTKYDVEQKRVAQLEEQLMDDNAGLLGEDDSATSDHVGLSLEQELQTSGDPPAVTTTLRLAVSRLEAENAVLRNNLGAQAEAERLRNEVELTNRRNEQLSLRYEEALEKLAITQEQLDALVAPMPADRDDAFTHMRTRAANTSAELDKARETIRKLEARVADKEREAMAAKTDLDAVGKESKTALEMVKSADVLVSHLLKVELDATRKLVEAKTFDYEELKAQLMDALVAKDKLHGRLEVVQTTAAPGQASSPAETPSRPIRKEDPDKMEKLKTALRQKMQQLEKAELDKYELQRKLKGLESGTALATQKATSDQVIKNLQRENAMITSAWYDLTKRLQSNHVVLPRRHDFPHSWLNKQRQLVNATPRK